MSTEIIYPYPPDDGFLDWSVNSGATNRYDAINEGTAQPDITNYVQKNVAGDTYFDSLYESGTFYDNVKAYWESVRVNFGPMTIRPSNSISMNLYAARISNEYYGSPSWGIGSFVSEGDYLLNYWTLDNGTTGLVSKITPGFTWSNAFSPSPVTFNTGKQSNAAVFNGSAFLLGSASTALNELYRFDSSKSFGGWIYNTTSSGDALIFSLGDGTARGSCCTLKLVDGGSIEFTIYRRYTSGGVDYGTAIQTVSTTAPELNRWSYVFCAIDTATRQLKISINGGAFVTASYTNYVINTVFDYMYLGGNPAVTFFGDLSSESISASYFSGKIDEWAMFDTDLSITQVNTLYNAGVGTTYPIDSFENPLRTTLYDKNGLEIASLADTPISSSGDLIAVNSTTPALYQFSMSDTSRRESVWDNYDFSNVYADIQFFTERKYTGIQYAWDGYNIPNTVGYDVPGTDDWFDPYNIQELDGNLAQVSSVGSDSKTLYASNFGFSIPTDAEITSVEIHLTTYFAEEPGGASNNPVLTLWLTDSSGTKIGDAQTNWTVADGITSLNDNDSLGLWGANLTQSIVTSSGFGVKLQLTVDGTKPYSFGVDYLALLVRYSFPTALDPAMLSTIFALDVEIDGQYISDNSIPLYINNTTVPEETTLHTISSITSSGDMPLATKGNLTSTDSTDLFIHGHDTAPTGLPLYTLGGLYSTESVDLVIANKHALLDCPLYLSGYDSITGDVPLNIFGKELDTDSTTMYIRGQIVTDDSGNMNMFISGWGGETTGATELNIWGADNPALRDTMTMFLNNVNSGETDGSMNLFISAPTMGDTTSNMNMFLNSDIPVYSNNVPFFLANEYVTDSGETTMFISAPGTTAGAYPANGNMNLFMARENQYNWLGMNMYMLVASGEDSNIPMYINSVPSDTGSVTLTFPNVTAPDSGEMSLYTHGF